MSRIRDTGTRFLVRREVVKLVRLSGGGRGRGAWCHGCRDGEIEGCAGWVDVYSIRNDGCLW